MIIDIALDVISIFLVILWFGADFWAFEDWKPRVTYLFLPLLIIWRILA